MIDSKRQPYAVCTEESGVRRRALDPDGGSPDNGDGVEPSREKRILEGEVVSAPRRTSPENCACRPMRWGVRLTVPARLRRTVANVYFGTTTCQRQWRRAVPAALHPSASRHHDRTELVVRHDRRPQTRRAHGVTRRVDLTSAHLDDDEAAGRQPARRDRHDPADDGETVGAAVQRDPVLVVAGLRRHGGDRAGGHVGRVAGDDVDTAAQPVEEAARRGRPPPPCRRRARRCGARSHRRRVHVGRDQLDGLPRAACPETCHPGQPRGPDRRPQHRSTTTGRPEAALRCSTPPPPGARCAPEGRTRRRRPARAPAEVRARRRPPRAARRRPAADHPPQLGGEPAAAAGRPPRPRRTRSPPRAAVRRGPRSTAPSWSAPATRREGALRPPAATVGCRRVRARRSPSDSKTVGGAPVSVRAPRARSPPVRTASGGHREPPAASQSNGESPTITPDAPSTRSRAVATRSGAGLLCSTLSEVVHASATAPPVDQVEEGLDVLRRTRPDIPATRRAPRRRAARRRVERASTSPIRRLPRPPPRRRLAQVVAVLGLDRVTGDVRDELVATHADAAVQAPDRRVMPTRRNERNQARAWW